MNRKNSSAVFIYIISMSMIGFTVFILFENLGNWFILFPVLIFLLFFSFFIFITKSFQNSSYNSQAYKKCINCQREIKSDEDSCPHCGADQFE